MQLASRARRGHVQEPRALEPRPRPPQALDVARQRTLGARAGNADRREQQFGVRSGARQLQPIEEWLAIAPLCPANARHDHDVPFEPFGAVHGKNFHGGARNRRRGVQLGGEIVEGIARQGLGAGFRRQRLDEFLRVEQVAFFAARRGAAQSQPGAIDPLPQGQRTLSPLERRRQCDADTREPCNGVGIEPPHARLIAD